MKKKIVAFKKKGSCNLLTTSANPVKIISKSRSKVTRRTKSYQLVNLQSKVYEFMIGDNFFRFNLKKISVRAIRTINKYGGIVNFLSNYKGKRPKFLELKNKINAN